jgi:hypothetical protein
MKKTWAIVPAVACLLLGGCAQQSSKYYWGGYSAAMLDYYGDATAEPAYIKALDDVLLMEAKGRKVPPGLYAETGYMALAKGDTGRAIELFGREKAAWPESAVFMDKAIASAKNRTPAPAPSTVPMS